jgi:hypothetical protein
MLLETSVPGVFATGDVRQASVKRVTTAMGEGAAVIQHVHQHLRVTQQSPDGRASGSAAAGAGLELLPTLGGREAA